MYQPAPFGCSTRILGLTGGIGTGKTTVSDYLAQKHHLPTLDADYYAREAVGLDSMGLAAIEARYGPKILLRDGTLDRAQLAQIIFHDSTEKLWIESLIHPIVRQQLEAVRVNLAQKPMVVMVIPLLFEAQMTDLVSEIWVVSCRPEQQLQRLMQRNGLTLPEAQVRIESQLPLAEKCDRADVVLDNSGDRTTLYAQIDRALAKSPKRLAWPDSDACAAE